MRVATMAVDWSFLRNPLPTTLAAACALAHRAAQWPARAALANLAPLPDDNHSSLEWDAGRMALVTQPLKDEVRVGLRVGVHELVFAKGAHTEAFPLAGASDADASQWLDARLATEGLQPASDAQLPYDMPPALFARASAEAPRLAALGSWFAAAAELLEELRKKHRRDAPGPVRCWPHHFDIAVVFGLGEGAAIGIGLSPGDAYYAQPYFYLSPYPPPAADELPPLPPGGRWHTQGFFGAVATAVDLYAQPDPRAALLQVLEAAFAESRRRLKAG
ncbi:MAG: hypothetical protein WD886_01070 [Burkholderiales bacterium]